MISFESSDQEPRLAHAPRTPAEIQALFRPPHCPQCLLGLEKRLMLEGLHSTICRVRGESLNLVLVQGFKFVKGSVSL